MKMPEFKSVYSEQMESFLNYRMSCGLKNVPSEYQCYRKLDRFLIAEGIEEITFTKDQASRWRSRFENESDIARYNRINNTKKFFEYLFVQGYKVFQFRDIKAPMRDFVPHIYTDDEVKKYFLAVDTYQSSLNRKNCVQLPVLFRILYGCGTRITETLMIRKKDVNLTEGIIKLSETKNANERYVVMSDSLCELMKQYTDKTFYELSDNDYIFRNMQGNYLSSDWINDLHVKILREAGIPYLGGGKGPRIHDWRHTFAVNAFRRMIDNAIDMYVALPVLSTYLGHKTIMATERYLRLTVSMYPHIDKKFGKTLDEIFGEDQI
jgi:integrase/recombinase XerD